MVELDCELSRGSFQLSVKAAMPTGVGGIFGPSGAGKTTLLRLVAGLERPDHGRILLNGRPITDTRRGMYVPIHRRGVAMVFQDACLLPHLNVRAGPDRPRV